MPHSISPLRVVPLSDDVRKSSQLGAEALLPDGMSMFEPSALSDVDKATLRQGLFDHGVVVIRNQQGLQPQTMYEISALIDPAPKPFHSGGEKQVVDPRNILSQNNCSRIPRAPQVTVIGHGRIEGHEGIPELELKHLDQSTFHETPLSDEELAQGRTRPYRWHMDAPLYETLPGYVTSLHALEVPHVPEQHLQFPQGESMPIAAGSTLFFSGARNFELLSPEEQEFALNTTVQYAPRAYEWIRDCKATNDGLSIASIGREKSLDDLPQWTWDKVHSYPMVWRNLGNDKPHLQILGCCVYSLTTVDPKTGSKTVIDDLAEVRRICHSLQSRVYKPENIFAFPWQEGDLVIFHNRGVMHSISGQLSHLPQRRLLWQCNMASGAPPEPYRTRAAMYAKVV